MVPGRAPISSRKTPLILSCDKALVFTAFIIMTDGIHNSGVAPDVVAQQVVQDNFLVIHGLTFGAGADQARMQTVADIGGGRFWHAADLEALEDAYNEIALDVPTVLTD